MFMTWAPLPHEKWKTHTCSFETHRYISAFVSNGTNMTSSREVFMQQKNREERKWVCLSNTGSQRQWEEATVVPPSYQQVAVPLQVDEAAPARLAETQWIGWSSHLQENFCTLEYNWLFSTKLPAITKLKTKHEQRPFTVLLQILE